MRGRVRAGVMKGACRKQKIGKPDAVTSSGSIDFDLAISGSRFLAGDSLSDLEVERTNQAKELIENFMIVANEVTAGFRAPR